MRLATQVGSDPARQGRPAARFHRKVRLRRRLRLPAAGVSGIHRRHLQQRGRHRAGAAAAPRPVDQRQRHLRRLWSRRCAILLMLRRHAVGPERLPMWRAGSRSPCAGCFTRCPHHQPLYPPTAVWLLSQSCVDLEAVLAIAADQPAIAHTQCLGRTAAICPALPDGSHVWLQGGPRPLRNITLNLNLYSIGRAARSCVANRLTATPRCAAAAMEHGVAERSALELTG